MRCDHSLTQLVVFGVALLVGAQSAAAQGDEVQLVNTSDAAFSYVRVADDPSLTVTEFTIEAWITPQGNGFGMTTDPGGAAIFSVGGEGMTGPFLGSPALAWRPSDGLLRLTVAETTGASGAVLTSTTAVMVGTSAHVAATFDGTTMRLYVNGALDASAPSGFSTMVTGPGDALIGAGNFNGGFVRRFTGEIDELRYWNVSRTGPEIAATWECAVDPGEPGLVGLWRFDGDSLNALTANGNDGVAQGSIAFQAAPADRFTACGVPCAADLTGDNKVDGADLAFLLSSWGECQ